MALVLGGLNNQLEYRQKLDFLTAKSQWNQGYDLTEIKFSEAPENQDGKACAATGGRGRGSALKAHAMQRAKKFRAN
jgi:hypothetical protein